MMLKTFALAFVAQLASVASLSPGDCAFVGVYGDQDDFALVMMEDVDGEVLYLTEETPSKNFEVSHSVTAKARVSNAKRGSVLRKADFEVDPSTFVAPSGLTVFTGSEKFPTPLCSINLESQGGTVARKLSEEVNVIMLGLTDTAQYVGHTSGSKEELLEEISNPMNWQRDGSRKLSAFSIAMKNETSTTTSAEQFRTVVSACTELGGDVAALADSKDAIAAFTTAIATVLNLEPQFVENVIFTPGSTCGGGKRRLGEGRRLQTTSGTVTYDLVFPPGPGSAEAAMLVMEQMETITIEEVQAAVTEAIKQYDSLKDITVTVTSVTTATQTEGGGSTATTSSGTIASSSSSSSSTTTKGGDEPPDEPDSACYKSLAFGLLVAIAGHVM